MPPPEQPTHEESKSEPALSPERQEQACRYARQRRRLLLLDLTVGAVYTLFWLLSGLSPLLARRIETAIASPWLTGGIYFLVFSIGYLLLDLPLSVYGGYILPRRYGLLVQRSRDWAGDRLKALGLMLAFGLLAVEGVYWLLRTSSERWWLWAALAYLGVTVVLANLAPVLIAPLFYRFTPLDDEDLSDRLLRLAEQAGTRVRGVYTFNMSNKTTTANAALMGLGNTRRIVLGDTLLTDYTAEEIETILAHELAHHAHRDVPIGIVVSMVETLIGLWLAGQMVSVSVTAFGFRDAADMAAFPLLVLILSLFGLIVMPLENAYSRWRERRADAYAIRATGNPRAFAHAMTRLANQNLAEAEPDAWVEFLLYTHPPIYKRIRMAEAEMTRMGMTI